jgi:uncharacterized membrane protein
MGAFGNFLIRVMRQVGYGICHQLPERSLHYGGRALPVCARDTGIFLGFTLCLAVLLIVYRRSAPRYPTWPKILVLAVLLLPTFFDAVTSYAGLRESSNAVRLVTGALAGTAVAALLFPLVAHALALVRRKESPEQAGRMLEPWWSLPALMVLPVILSLAMWPRWPGAFWFWSIAVTLVIVFTFLALNFSLVALVFEWVQGVETAPAPTIVAAIAIAAAFVELAASNRLHWLADRLL